MALTPEQRSTIWTILKDHYIDTVTNTLHKTIELLSKIESNSKDVHGRQVIIKYRTGGNQGVGNRAERATLPTAGGRTFQEGISQIVSFYAALDLTGQEINAISSKAAFVNLVTDAMEDTKSSARNDLNRQMWLDGSGAIGTVASVAGNVITLTKGAGNALHFPVGMEVEIWSSGGVQRVTPAYAKVLEIDTTDLSAPTVTLDSMPTGVVGTDLIYRNGNYVSTADLELMGLKGHISASNPPLGTYQGKNRATAGNGYLRAHVDSNGGVERVITALLLTKVMDKVRSISGDTPTALFTSSGVRNAYMSLLASLNQSVAPVVSKTGFAEELQYVYGGQPITMTVMDDAPRNKIYMFSPKYFEFREAAKLQWETGNGGNLTVAETQDRSWARMYGYHQLVCLKPTSAALIDNVKPDSHT